MKGLLTVVAVAAALAAMTSTSGHANGDIRDAWLQAYPDICPDLVTAAQTCQLCHGGDVPNLDPYGQDLVGVQDAADILATGSMDSDGDGRTNVQEITQDCTNPGDPLDVPVDEKTWSEIKDLYR